MAANRHIQDFYELRVALMGMSEAVGAALGFLDKNGIAMRAHTNGRPKQVHLAKLREQVKRHYKQRRPLITGSARLVPQLRGKDRLRAQRQISANMLATLDPVEPRQLPADFGKHGLGPLVRRGYIKRKRDGYIRTAKPFIVEKGSHAASVNGNSATDGTITAAEAAPLLKCSEANVRLLVKSKRLQGRIEQRQRKGMKKFQPMLVLNRDEVLRYAADKAAGAAH